MIQDNQRFGGIDIKINQIVAALQRWQDTFGVADQHLYPVFKALGFENGCAQFVSFRQGCVKGVISELESGLSALVRDGF